jgi:UDP-N-acetylglucosamine 2-epimerase (non-hydrolysing)
MRLCIVYGTRPEFLKLKVLMERVPSNTKIVRILQHVDYHEDDGYYTDLLNIDEVSGDRLCDICSSIIHRLPKLIKDCTHVLAQGDTASCYYSLLCAFQMKKICIHLEAGMRTRDLKNPWPEEAYRQMISRFVDIHLCPSQKEKENLINEQIDSKKIHVVGNTILDLVKSYKLDTTPKNNVLVTLHRRENWDSYRQTIQNLNKLVKSNKDFTFYFLTHPNPSLKKIIEEENLECTILNGLEHKKLIELLGSCNCVITDSGGIQEEANFIGKFMYILRKITERNSMKPHKYKLVENFNDIDIKKSNLEQGFEYGDGNSVSLILRTIFPYVTYQQIGINGRLGNQMFQYAATKGLAHKLGCVPVFPCVENRYWHGQKCELFDMFNLRNYETCDVSFPEHTYIIKAHRDEEAEFFDCIPNTNIEGFPESEFYFRHIKDEIQEEFTFKEPPVRLFNEETVAIHIRRGDYSENEYYFSNSEDTEWLKTFLSRSLKNFKGTEKFLIFTGGSRIGGNANDEEWCSSYFKKNFPNLDVHFPPKGTSDIDSFKLFTTCDHAILNSTSTLGWWSSYLIKNPNKKVIVPWSCESDTKFDPLKFWPKEYITIKI